MQVQKQGVMQIRDLRKTLQGRASNLDNAAEARGLTDAQHSEQRGVMRTIEGAEQYVRAQSLRGAIAGPDPDAALRRFAFSEVLRTRARRRPTRPSA